MEYTEGELKETFQVLQRKWGIEAVGDVEKNRFEAIFGLLKARIGLMLEEDFSGLVNAMYRLDIPEESFNQALALQSPDAVASRLTELVLRREILRIRTYNAYKQRNQTD